MPTGAQLLTSSSEAVQGSTTEKTFCSRMRRAMSWVYCAPKSRMTMDSLSLDWGSTDEFLKSSGACKGRRSHRCCSCEICTGAGKTQGSNLHGQVRNVAEDRLVAVDRSLWRRSGQGRRDRKSLRHFRNANIAREAHYVEPVGDAKVNERDENHGGGHEPRWHE